jgi:O-antigen ligase
LATVLLAAGLGQVQPQRAGLIVVVGAIGAVCVWLGLMLPAVSVLLLLGTLFFRLPLSGPLPADPFWAAFVGVVAASVLAAARRVARIRFGGVELAMLAYLAWNIGSAVAEHPYAAMDPATGEYEVIGRAIATGVAIPFTAYVVGRQMAGEKSMISWLMWVLLGFTAYSAAMSVLQIHGPQSLVWPREILDTAWPGRASGIFNQAVVNGLILIIGFVAALLVAAQPGARLRRYTAIAIACGAAYGVYLTHTRAVWLAFVLVAVLGALFAKRFRIGFLITIATVALAIPINWSDFVSSDRAAGGVTSANEALDRLNIIATALWAIEQKPLFGWGIASFLAVNTYHHQQWSWDVPWARGWGTSSHLNELGIAAELGLIGLALWLTVLVLMFRRLARCTRVVDGPGLGGSGIVFLAGSSLIALVITGFTVDLRFFDFANTLVLLLVGIAAGLADKTEGPEGAPAGSATGLPLPASSRAAVGRVGLSR